ncbi:hypothetical protein BRADI_2g32410v3 [Brachypodium distachyon]|uniref:Uncharacterized protein n=1 Tax=Brachypodium distachyon TaxID=15368 RepID=A0A2K2DBF3_BRADI|nr:hypothetical protein BRADI_2g32410v3 [Brachypodium distachyon]
MVAATVVAAGMGRRLPGAGRDCRKGAGHSSKASRQQAGLLFKSGAKSLLHARIYLFQIPNLHSLIRVAAANLADLTANQDTVCCPFPFAFPSMEDAIATQARPLQSTCPTIFPGESAMAVRGDGDGQDGASGAAHRASWSQLSGVMVAASPARLTVFILQLIPSPFPKTSTPASCSSIASASSSSTPPQISRRPRMPPIFILQLIPSPFPKTYETLLRMDVTSSTGGASATGSSILNPNCPWTPAWREGAPGGSSVKGASSPVIPFTHARIASGATPPFWRRVVSPGPVYIHAGWERSCSGAMHRLM